MDRDVGDLRRLAAKRFGIHAGISFKHVGTSLIFLSFVAFLHGEGLVLAVGVFAAQGIISWSPLLFSVINPAGKFPGAS